MKEKVKETKTVKAWAVMEKGSKEIRDIFALNGASIVLQIANTRTCARKMCPSCARVVPVKITYEVTR